MHPSDLTVSHTPIVASAGWIILSHPLFFPMATISIPDTTVDNNVTFYCIKISLPLRSISVSRRYTDFVNLTDGLCRDLGISRKDFPYPLPPKAGLFGSKSTVIADRKVRLSTFLNSVIRDREVQNSPRVHRFLELPVNFRFTTDHFKELGKNVSGIGDSDGIDSLQWLSYFRHVRSSISALPKPTDLGSRLETRESLSKNILPSLEKLSSSLGALADSGAIDKSELSKRTALLLGLQAEIEKHTATGSNTTVPQTTLGRIFSMAREPPQETDKTMALDNRQLLQQQQLVHKQQDQELEQLRKIIGRQKQIGEAIHREVEEQNEMLDEFSAEVEASSDKLKSARSRARQIG